MSPFKKKEAPLPPKPSDKPFVPTPHSTSEIDAAIRIVTDALHSGQLDTGYPMFTQLEVVALPIQGMVTDPSDARFNQAAYYHGPYGAVAVKSLLCYPIKCWAEIEEVQRRLKEDRLKRLREDQSKVNDQIEALARELGK